MRHSLFSRFLAPSRRVKRWFSLAIGLLWSASAWSGAAQAADAPDKKLERLGFSFDQQTHDAAIAAAAARERMDIGTSDAPPPGVVRLPKYTLTERVDLEERRMLTPKGRLEVAEKRYLTPIYQKTLGPLSAVASFLNNPIMGGWAPNAPEAMALYEDGEQKRRNAEMRDLTDLAALNATLEKPAAKQKSKKSSK